jgi:hypothetical protein
MGTDYSRFVHIEQHAALRTGSGITQMSTAVKSVFPAR